MLRPKSPRSAWRDEVRTKSKEPVSPGRPWHQHGPYCRRQIRRIDPGDGGCAIGDGVCGICSRRLLMAASRLEFEGENS